MYSPSFQEILCQLNSSSQSAFVFFSSTSVVLIAVDRLLYIAYPAGTQISTGQAFLLSAVGFVCCAAFSSPLFFFTKLEVLFLDASYCYEVILHIYPSLLPRRCQCQWILLTWISFSGLALSHVQHRVHLHQHRHTVHHPFPDSSMCLY